ncbi:hypothetical protein JI721_15090 [Alicyclobacillus cycloheptanicus]|uniref:Uncharacterized protein n=1 Tax=Alicyclobacillus cycloheptanicus TaxID=1457 RepID=A0ABT9XDB7_9BACL|nr:hypothetical protein [Alicyclobacillus cycloheptanicus]MDQ0188265.1 hypothetical protein [Alicyclobacillus cycloheptanicus]WDM00983.1 hypothetical protein JI721_15090 [Alicyclobacillus cycloheptanicus]
MINKAIYPLKERWDTFKPFLNHPEVRQALQNGMDAWKANRPPYPFEDRTPWNEDKDGGPWALTDAGWFWLDLQDTVEQDEEFQAEAEVFQRQYLNAHPDVEEDEVWVYFMESDEYTALYERISKKYEPQKGDMAYYKLKAGCHWVVDFMYELIRKAIPDAEEWGTITTASHSVAYFVQDGIMYFVDLLNEWDSVQQLEEFMGGPIDVLTDADSNLPEYVEWMQFIRRDGDGYVFHVAGTDIRTPVYEV